MSHESKPPPDRDPAARSEPPPPAISELPPPRGDAGWVQRVGEACAFALGIALLVAVPTALRASGEPGGSFLTAWLVGAAVLVPVLAITMGLVRAAGRGFRALAAPGAARARGLGVAMWVGLSVPALVVLGALLRSLTNHRGLGGATFGVVGLGIVVVAALVAFRLVEMGQRRVERGARPKPLAWLGVGVALAPLVLSIAPLFFLDDGGAPTDRLVAALLDGSIAVVIVALVATVDLAESARRAVRLAGVPAAALVVILGIGTVESRASLSMAMRTGGGLAAAFLGALESWSDRDGDGHGAYFGGGDCDEGDARRHPGATDLARDGVDHDCDGVDGPPAATTTGALAAAASGAPPAGDESPAAPASPASPVAEPNLAGARPPIVLVTLDAVRADRTSAYGYAKATTPALEALAARGFKLARAYAPASDTQRALMPIVTGLRLSQTPRGTGKWPTLYPEAVTLAEHLKAAGYATGAVSSFTWLRRDRGYDQGFDYFEEAFREDHPERGVTGPHAVAAAKEILRRFEGESRPTFLWVHLFDAHADHVSHEGIDFGADRGGRYDAEIAFVDRQLGALVEAVGATPRGAEAVWIVHGSHGYGLGEKGHVGHGDELFEPHVRVPLVVVAPGVRPATIDARAVSTGDIAPTLLELAGVQGAEVEGQSLLPLLRWAAGDEAQEGPAPERSPVYVRGYRRAVLVDGPLKLLRVIRDRGKPRHQLFDVDADPGEERDLSGSREAELARMMAVLDERERGAKDQQYRRKRPASGSDDDPGDASADGEPAPSAPDEAGDEPAEAAGAGDAVVPARVEPAAD